MLCTNCGYDRRTRSRVIRRSDDEAGAAAPSPFAFLWSPAAVALGLLTAWGFFFFAATRDPALIMPYRTAVFIVGGAAFAVMVIGIIHAGLDWEDWVWFLYHPELFLLRGDYEGYTQVVLMTSILAAGGIPYLVLSRAAAAGVGP